MKHTLLAVSLVVMLVLSAGAQQQNSSVATMLFNNYSGLSAPITANCAQGNPVQVRISSELQGMPFLVGYSSTLLANGIPWGQNIVDLSPVGSSIPFNGLVDPMFNTGPTGIWRASFTIANNLPVGTANGLQTAIVDASSSVGASVTAASRLIVTTPVITSTPMTLGDDNSVVYSVANFGMSLPFYAQNYTGVYVHSNGELCFGTGSSDFTLMTNEFISQMPRISGK